MTDLFNSKTFGLSSDRTLYFITYAPKSGQAIRGFNSPIRYRPNINFTTTLEQYLTNIYICLPMAYKYL